MHLDRERGGLIQGNAENSHVIPRVQAVGAGGDLDGAGFARIAAGDLRFRDEAGSTSLLRAVRPYDAFQEEARRCYWEQANRGLFSHGIDAWWCDCTEHFESDWRGAVRPEPHERLPLNTGEAKRYLDPGYIGAFSLLHSQGIAGAGATA